jgi:hypothetical protein
MPGEIALKPFDVKPRSAAYRGDTTRVRVLGTREVAEDEPQSMAQFASTAAHRGG